MNKIFKTIGLFARHSSAEVVDTLLNIVELLNAMKRDCFIEADTALMLDDDLLPAADRETIRKECDLLIVVGGDGSLLNVASFAVEAGIPILGVNRGRLGFLTDIKPSEINTTLKAVLNGEYQEEKRFLLKTTTMPKKQHCIALNEVVFGSCSTATMLDFELYIDERFVCSHRSDGIIIATPTGSTAYALSGGGPILHPSLDAMVIVPMFPHTLTQRPIVVHGDSKIKIIISHHGVCQPQFSCDSHYYCDVHHGDTLMIEKLDKKLRLIHPLHYDYFSALHSKLHWGRKLIDT